MDIKPVIVQALFDINRDKWDNFTMSYHTYLHWMRNVLSLDNPIVVYTEEKFFKAIFDNRKVYDPKMEKTKIIVQKLEDLTAYKLFYNRVETLMKSKEFKNKTSFDVPEMTKPLYNIIMFNKMYWLKNARDNNFFDGNVLVWKDAGTYREDVINYANKKWPDPKKIDMSKITFFSHHERISILNIEDHALSQMRFIHGTCCIVPNDKLDKLIDNMEQTIIESLNNGYIGSDEKMFDITYLKSPEDYKLIKADWREYFPFFSFDTK
jgi:hypothetical protein